MKKALFSCRNLLSNTAKGEGERLSDMRDLEATPGLIKGMEKRSRSSLRWISYLMQKSMTGIYNLKYPNKIIYRGVYYREISSETPIDVYLLALNNSCRCTKCKARRA